MVAAAGFVCVAVVAIVVGDGAFLAVVTVVVEAGIDFELVGDEMIDAVLVAGVATGVVFIGVFVKFEVIPCWSLPISAKMSECLA